LQIRGDLREVRRGCWLRRGRPPGRLGGGGPALRRPGFGLGSRSGLRLSRRGRFFAEEPILFPQIALGREHPFLGDLELFLLVRHVENPPMSEKTENPDLQKLVDLVARLRAPDGCPWDREQTLPDVRAYLLEEAHELAGAIDGADWDELAE